MKIAVAAELDEIPDLSEQQAENLRWLRAYDGYMLTGGFLELVLLIINNGTFSSSTLGLAQVSLLHKPHISAATVLP